jgi:dUTP pyrophosphatase
MRVQVLDPGATLPKRQTPGSAGYDLATSEDFEILPGQRRLVKTGLRVAVPEGTYGRVAPRSGLAVRYGIQTLAGVVDCDYRGELGVVLINHGSDPFRASRGDRIAQLVLERVETPDVAVVDDLDDTRRGEGGFGSTLVK